MIYICRCEAAVLIVEHILGRRSVIVRESHFSRKEKQNKNIVTNAETAMHPITSTGKVFLVQIAAVKPLRKTKSPPPSIAAVDVERVGTCKKSKKTKKQEHLRQFFSIVSDLVVRPYMVRCAAVGSRSSND